MAPDLDNKSAIKQDAGQDFIPLFSGRPKRERVIGKDDLLDLDILLHTCDTVEGFLAKA